MPRDGGGFIAGATPECFFFYAFLGKTAFFIFRHNVKGDGKAVKKKSDCRFRVSEPKLLKLLRNAIGNFLHMVNGARECFCGFVWFVCVS